METFEFVQFCHSITLIFISFTVYRIARALEDIQTMFRAQEEKAWEKQKGGFDVYWQRHGKRRDRAWKPELELNGTMCRFDSGIFVQSLNLLNFEDVNGGGW